MLPGVQARPADAAFAAAGWARDSDVLVLTAPIGPPRPVDVPAQLAEAPDDAWLAGYRYRDRELPPVAREVLTNAEDTVFAAVRLAPDPAPVAAERGTHSVYLQVTADNGPARSLYRRAGFIEHHRYHYRRQVA
jgi:hypothetical protein